MKLKKIELINNGEVITTWVLSLEQYHSLLQHAINDLTMKGIVTTINLSPEEVEKLQKESLEELKHQFLDELDPKTMPQA